MNEKIMTDLKKRDGRKQNKKKMPTSRFRGVALREDTDGKRKKVPQSIGFARLG